jgi:hypothetical protein
VDGVEPLKNMCIHFVESILYNKTPRSDGKSGLRVIEVLESIDRSIKDNGGMIHNAN